MKETVRERKKLKPNAPVVSQNDQAQTSVTKQVGTGHTSENGEQRRARGGNTSGKVKKKRLKAGRQDGYVPKKVASGKKPNLGSSVSPRPKGDDQILLRRKFGRIIEPKSARIGEGLSGLGRLLCASLLVRCGNSTVFGFG